MPQRYDANGNPIADDAQPTQSAAPDHPSVLRYDAQGNPIDAAPASSSGELTTADLIRGHRQQTPGYETAIQSEQSMRGPQSERMAPGPIRDITKFIENNLGGTALHGFTNQIPHNLGIDDEMAAGTSYVTQAISNLINHFTGKPTPVTASDAGHAAADYAHRSGDEYAQQHPFWNGMASGAGIVAGGAPSRVTGPITALRQALMSGVVDAPFAVARQEGSVPERVQKALPEIGISSILGGAFQGLANRLTRGGAPASAARLAQFEQAGVRPTLAGVTGNATSRMTQAIGENWLAGGRVRAALHNSVDDTAAAADRIAHGYAAPQPRELAGESVQEGVRRFAQDNLPNPNGAVAATPTREWSFAGKANALYDDIFSQLAHDERSFIDDGVPVPITTAATQSALQAIRSRVAALNVAEIVNNPMFERIGNALNADQHAIRFNDLRALRTWVREAQANPELRQNVGAASLGRLESALTQDIYDSAAAIGHGTNLSHQLQRADQFYAAGMDRINTALRQFDPTRGVSPAAAYDHIINMASDRSGANSGALLSLKRTLNSDEWRTVAATVIDRMGAPTPGAAGAMAPNAFSVQRFATAYNQLSPAGRRLLFSSHGGGTAADDALMAELDNLAHVADMQRGVERMANHSNSGVSLQNVGTLGGLANPGTTLWTMAGLGGAMVTGEMLTNPMFVRWLAGAPIAGAAGHWGHHLATLAQMAAHDPSLGQFYAQIAGALPPQQSAQTQEPTQQPAPAQ